MRILGFSQMWPKLAQETFTTFRFARKDRDWEVGEIVQVVLHPRRKGGGEALGVAEIVGKEPRRIPWRGQCGFEAAEVTNAEANADGFPDGMEKVCGRLVPQAGYFRMWEFLFKAYGPARLFAEPVNKLTLTWRERA